MLPQIHNRYIIILAGIFFVILVIEVFCGLDFTLKFVQTVFYSVGALIAVLTYKAAMKSWLLPTNTEYQKKVMERLSKLAEDLLQEFDPNFHQSLNRQSYIESAKYIYNEYIRLKDKIEIKQYEKVAPISIPFLKDVLRWSELLRSVRSDPFIPENIREKVVDLLEKLIEVKDTIYRNCAIDLMYDLFEGKAPQPFDFICLITFHNLCCEKFNDHTDCRPDKVWSQVHNIRGMIQDYFDSFNPHGVGKGLRKNHEIKINDFGESNRKLNISRVFLTDDMMKSILP